MKLSQLGMPSGLPLVHLHPTSVVELGWMSKMLASVRDRLSPNREGCFQWKKKKKPMAVDAAFFSLTDGS